MKPNPRNPGMSTMQGERPSDMFFGLFTATALSVGLWASLIAGYVLIR